MHLPVKVKAEAAVVPEVNQVETDQALDLKAEALAEAEALLKRRVHQLQEELSRELIKGV